MRLGSSVGEQHLRELGRCVAWGLRSAQQMSFRRLRALRGRPPAADAGTSGVLRRAQGVGVLRQRSPGRRRGQPLLGSGEKASIRTRVKEPPTRPAPSYPAVGRPLRSPSCELVHRTTGLGEVTAHGHAWLAAEAAPADPRWSHRSPGAVHRRRPRHPTARRGHCVSPWQPPGRCRTAPSRAPTRLCWASGPSPSHQELTGPKAKNFALRLRLNDQASPGDDATLLAVSHSALDRACAIRCALHGVHRQWRVAVRAKLGTRAQLRRRRCGGQNYFFACWSASCLCVDRRGWLRSWKSNPDGAGND